MESTGWTWQEFVQVQQQPGEFCLKLRASRRKLGHWRPSNRDVASALELHNLITSAPKRLQTSYNKATVWKSNRQKPNPLLRQIFVTKLLHKLESPLSGQHGCTPSAPYAPLVRQRDFKMNEAHQTQRGILWEGFSHKNKNKTWQLCYFQ